MNRHRLIAFATIFSFLALGFATNNKTWKSQPHQWQGNINTIQFDHAYGYVATDQGLYQFMIDQQLGVFTSFKQLMNENIYDAVIKGSIILVASQNAVYQSFDAGQKWDRIFTANEDDGEVCYHVHIKDETVFIGTNKGLYYRKVGGLRFTQVGGQLEGGNIYDIESDGDTLIVATPQQVFGIDDHVNAYEIYTYGTRLDDQEYRPVLDIKIVDGRVIVATTQGIQWRYIKEGRWNGLPTYGLPARAVNDMLIRINEADKLDVIVSTDKGVYALVNDSWTPIYNGLAHSQMDVLANINGDVYVSSRAELFKLDNTPQSKSVNHEDMWAHFSNEPSIRLVQDKAIRYGEVHPSKIESWRRRAKWKALLPTVDVDGGRGATDLYHWDTGQSPDALQKGNDYTDWGVSLSWDLGNVIWNSDQTDIDVRSRLMVQLREDILDQVNRIYFERRRLQMELYFYGQDVESMILMEKQLRIDELTAQLDAYTGGWFSQQI